MPTKTGKKKSAWSAKDIYDMFIKNYGFTNVKSRAVRKAEADKYTIPYIPEKEIMLTTGRYNTGKISTNVLDSIYNAAKRTNVPVDIALGLAGRESTLGIGRGFKRGQSISGTDLMSNWQQIQPVVYKDSERNRWNKTVIKEKSGQQLNEQDYLDRLDFLIKNQDAIESTKALNENPIDNALKLYQSGKYNPGDKRHTQMVEEDAKVLMSDPAIQKWLKTKTETQMKCGGRRKAQLGLDIREGGIAIPIANNMFYINGRKHAAGGVAIGPNNKNGVEVEGGEVVEMIDSNHPSVGRQFKAGGQQQTMRVFSSVPFLQGVSPAELVLRGANPNKVFKAQEEFKDRNRINDDGSRYENGGKIAVEGAKTIGGYLPFIGTALDAYELYKNPSWKQAGWTGLGLLTDIFTGGSARAVMKTARNLKNAKEALSIVRGPITKRIYKDAAVNAIKANNKAKKDVIRDATINIGQNYVQHITDKYEMGGEKIININNLPSSFKGRKIGNNYYQIGFPPALSKAKYWNNKFSHHLNSLNVELKQFGNDILSLGRNAIPKYGKKYYDKTIQKVKEVFISGETADINNNAQRLGRLSALFNTDNDKKEYGGMIYTINGNVKNGLMSARPKAQYGKIININRDSYETVDEAVERYKQLYRIKYGKDPSKANIDRIAWIKTFETTIEGDPNLITGYGPNVGVRGLNVAKIVSGANKGRQIGRTQTVVRNKNVKSATPQKQAINTKVSQAARTERQSQFDAWQQGEAFKASTMPTDAVAVNRPTISTGVRSGRKGRVDDVIAIERSQRSVDPLSSKPEFSVYDKAYAKKANNKMNQFANALLASGTGGIIAGSMTYDDIVGDTIYDKELPVQNHIVVNNNQTNKSVNSNIKTQNKASNNNSVKGTNNAYVSTTKPNTGESYVINPLTGEWIRNGVTETSEPSVKGTTKVSSKSSSTPRREGTSSAAYRGTATVESPKPTTPTNPMEARYASRVKKGTAQEPVKTEKTVTEAAITPDQVRYTRAAGFQNGTSQPSTGGQTGKKPKDDTEGSWIGQYKTTNVGDWIGLGSNLAGSVASYFMTKNAINKMPSPVKPVMAQAAKLKTRYNIEPQLSEIREAEQMNRATVRRNTQSSNTSIAREQRLMNEARGAKNTLYGQKENIETQLINKDRLNRQAIMMENVNKYNEYLNRVTATKMAQNEMRVSNINNLISGLTGSVNSILGNIESRRATNNTLRAIAAANPNVDARLIGGFDYYIDPITKKKYNKNQQYVGTING